jgi:hypothetical protein
MESYFCPTDRQVVSLILNRREVNELYNVMDWARQNMDQTRCQEHFEDSLRLARTHFEEMDAGVVTPEAQEELDTLNDSSDDTERPDDSFSYSSNEDDDYYEDEDEYNDD